MTVRRWWPFALLCGVAATSWMLTERLPEVQFSLWGDALACAAAAICCGVIAQGEPSPAWRAAIGGMLVVVGPALPSLTSVSSGGGLSIALALTSVVIAVATPAIAGSEFATSSLWPGLAAAAALLIAEPMPRVSDWRSDVILLAAPVATGIGAVLFCSGGGSAARKMCGALGLAMMVFGTGAVMQHAIRRSMFSISLIAVLLEASLFVLSLLALQRLTPSQYAVRYALVPLLLLGEGVAMVSRELLNRRTAACACLLIAASATMLRTRGEENAA